MLKDVQSKAKHKMETSIETLRKELGGVRTGRASISVLDDVRIEAYGVPTPLNQVANLSVPEGNLIVISPWDATQIPAIERAIQKANLGLTPASDGKVVRVPVPPLTEERRKEMAKKIQKVGEEVRTAIRNVRRDANEDVKKLEKDKLISQDDGKKGLKLVQDMTDEFIARVDELIKNKEREILEIHK